MKNPVIGIVIILAVLAIAYNLVYQPTPNNGRTTTYPNQNAPQNQTYPNQSVPQNQSYPNQQSQQQRQAEQDRLLRQQQSQQQRQEEQDRLLRRQECEQGNIRRRGSGNAYQNPPVPTPVLEDCSKI